MPATLQIDPATSGMSRADQFSDDEFEIIENVPTFAEHVTQTPNGRTLKFGPEELQAVANRCNQRIEETGDYAVCCIGHTPSPEAKAKGAPDPDVIGFVGPFRLGRMQRPNGGWRYFILARYRIFKSELERFRRHPRRSPELWIEDRYEDMFLDPIALLGAEPPRLDMGLCYSRHKTGEGREILKYSAAPGAMNAFIPDERLRHAAEAEGNAMDEQEIVRSVIDALTELPVWRWMESQMQAENEAGENTGGMADGTAPTEAAEAPVEAPAEPAADLPPVEAPPVEAPPVDAPAEPAVDAPAPPVDAAPEVAAEPAEEVTDPAEREKMQRYAALDELTDDMDDDEFEQYAAARRTRRSKRRKGYSCEEAEVEVEVDVESDDQPEQYSRRGEVAKYAKRIAALEAEVANSKRREVLVDLQLNQGIILDVDEEMERLCYQKMPSHDDFEANCRVMRKHYKRSPVAGLPIGLADEDVAQVVQYQRQNPEQIANAAKDLVMKYRREGKSISYEDARKEVLEKRALRTA